MKTQSRARRGSRKEGSSPIGINEPVEKRRRLTSGSRSRGGRAGKQTASSIVPGRPPLPVRIATARVSPVSILHSNGSAKGAVSRSRASPTGPENSAERYPTQEEHTVSRPLVRPPPRTKFGDTALRSSSPQDSATTGGQAFRERVNEGRKNQRQARIPDESGSDEDLEVYPIQRSTPPLLTHSIMSLQERYDISPGAPPLQEDVPAGRLDGGSGRVRLEVTALQDSDEVNNSSSPQLSPVRNDLEAARTMRSLLSISCKDMEDLMQRELSGLRSELFRKFQELTTWCERVAGQLGELRVLHSGGQYIGKGTSKTPLSQYLETLDSATPYADWVFNANSVAKVLKVNVPHMVMSVVKQEGNLEEHASVALRALLFGLQNNQTRVAFATGIGKRHCSFRYSVVLNSFYNVQNNRFKQFIDTENQMRDHTTHDTHATGKDNGAQVISEHALSKVICQREWLRRDFVTQGDVTEARRRLETQAKKLSDEVENVNDDGSSKPAGRWFTVKEIPSRRDIATFGALKVYRIITECLKNARQYSKLSLFEELTYVMSSWDKLKAPFSQRDLRMKWVDERTEDMEFDIHRIAQCQLRSAGPTPADEKNTKLLSDFLASRKEMMVVVTHPVDVTPVTRSKKAKGSVRKTLTRAINLIDVAVKFCCLITEQTQVGCSPTQFLGASTESLRSVYAIAVILRSMVQVFMDEYIVGGAFLASDTKNIKDLEVYGLKMTTLYPAVSVQTRLLAKRCFSLSEYDFMKMDLNASRCPPTTVRQGQAENVDVEIIPSTDFGVMLV